MGQLNSCLNKYVRRSGYSEQGTGDRGQQDKISFSRQLLSVFCKDAERAVVTLKETIANGDIKLFITTAHAMKAALANIGEDNISEAAFALEKAGLDGNKEFIAANAGHFIETLESLIQRFSTAEAAEDKSSNEGAAVIEDTAFLVEQLQIVKQACEDYDRKAAFTALDLLKEKQWNAKTQAAFESLGELISLHSDFEKAAEQAKTLLEGIVCD
jgi:HPt (histidine-containing phosphotransfer) domain-containing protein